jgi:hypothetical protein
MAVKSAGVDWYEVFLSELKAIKSRHRVLTTFLPKCDGRYVGLLAIRYIQNSKSPAERRKARGLAVKAETRERIRDLQAEIKNGRAGEFEKAELVLAKFRLHNSGRAFATKRFGVSGNHNELFHLREYLRIAAGVAPDPIDLASILRAAHVAQGRDIFVDEDLVRKNLANFMKNNPEACELTTAQLMALLRPSQY